MNTPFPDRRLPTDPRLARVVEFYEELTPLTVARLGKVYSDDACFKDPFNDVKGVAAIRAIFEHMFVKLQTPRFVVLTAVAGSDQAFLTWDFHFRLQRGGEVTIQGATHLRFALDGRVIWHRDYWDAAEEFYEKLPLLGNFMRWLRRRARA